MLCVHCKNEGFNVFMKHDTDYKESAKWQCPKCKIISVVKRETDEKTDRKTASQHACLVS